MSIQVFQVTRPAKYQGLEDLFPSELVEGIQETVRRLVVNDDALINSIRDQLFVDTSLVPTIDNGSAATGTQISATIEDTDQAVAMARL